MTAQLQNSSAEIIGLRQQIQKLEGELRKAQSDLETTRFTHQELINIKEKAINDLKVCNYIIFYINY